MDTLWCCVLRDVETGEKFSFSPNDGGMYVEKMLSFLDTCRTLVFHNGIGYDFPLLLKLFGYEFKGQIVDTLIMSRLLFPKRKQHSVDSWGLTFGVPKPKHEDWTQFSPEMLYRCEQDVEIQLRIYNHCMKKARSAKGASWMNAFKMSFKLFEILQKQQDYGWLLDQEYARAKVQMTTHWMERIDRVLVPNMPILVDIEHGKEKGVVKYYKKPYTQGGKLQHFVVSWLETLSDFERQTTNDETICGPFTKVCFRPVDPNKREEVVQYLLDMGWIPKEWNTNDAGERTSPKMSKDETFEGVEGKAGQLLAKRVQIRHRRSTIEGWLERVRPDGRLPSVVTGIAATGRMKHSVIVNVPNADAFFGKQMRRCFTSPEGRVLIGCDAASCQDRMLAQRAGVDEFKDMLLNGDKSKGTDGHSLAMKAVNKAHERFKLAPIRRGKAKGYNFAFKFGASDNKLGKMSNREKKVGTFIRECLREVFHAQAALVDKLTKEWRSNATRSMNKWGKLQYKNGWIRGLDGRPIFIESEHAILVYMLQSDEAITMSAAYCMMYKRILDAGYKWGDDFAIVCFYHDEVTVECREEIAQPIAKIMEECIGDAGHYFKLNYCPQAGDAEIGKDWYAIH
ncbi:DNA-directed DNA polymerase, family A, palm domain [Vibrio phage 1.293.O._10N.261.52.E1]|nr:DNA-directed DNA polymerase, family A, palm domain [Vibrio phage 1.293.O._10N.261.52.E1]